MACEINNINESYTDIQSYLKSENNDISVVTGFDAINNSINNILTIRNYEIPSQPQEFIDLYSYLHEIADEITFEAMRIEIKDVLARWETRISVMEVIIDDFSTDNYIVLTIVYKLRNDVANNLQSTTVTIKG